MRRHRTRAFPLVLVVACCMSAFAQRAATAGNGTDQIAAAAQKFLGTLDDTQRGKLLFDFKDEQQRKRWSNLPQGAFRREGLRMGDLTQPQCDAAMAVLKAALSPAGYEKVMQIVEADEVLKNGDGGKGGKGGGGKGGKGGPGGGASFGRDNYYISFLGQPSATEPWMMQFGGHHLGLNISFAGQHSTLAPSHTGAAGDLRARRERGASLGSRSRQGIRAAQFAERNTAQASHSRLPNPRPRARPRPGRANDSARRNQRLGPHRQAARHAARLSRRMDGNHARNGRSREDG